MRLRSRPSAAAEKLAPVQSLGDRLRIRQVPTVPVSLARGRRSRPCGRRRCAELEFGLKVRSRKRASLPVGLSRALLLLSAATS